VIELAQIVAGWPLVISMAAAVAVQGLREGRRRSVLNEALHELRRPLQAVALASGPGAGDAGPGESPIELAAAALERLELEINGGSPAPAWGTIDGQALVRAAVSRWRPQAELADASLELRWNAGTAVVKGDRCALGQALDNLIVNALEHGGPAIVVAARLRGGRLRVAVVDSGCAHRPRSRHRAAGLLTGRRAHGHGLAVVRRIAAAHDGEFGLRRSERGSIAVLELPLAGSEDGGGRWS
jgi:signal transduction histidine kinase